ncbi:MAG: DNA translocase FtsK [Anaerolineae bacterium]|jgi:DNA segregation ATPase FtsK/SpoIIIE-like protein|nr:DNA translocase FtsK [Anaerolineae bacterium]MBT7190480.1 DNA translocase FtsK [Anaerolineae bacterium]MBT7774245.1 DNA translocase FtsK [Anaerolineae bacterium]
MIPEKTVGLHAKKHRLEHSAQHIAKGVLAIMRNRTDTEANAVEKWVLVENEFLIVLFAVLDDANLPNLAPYLATGKNSLIYHLQTVLQRPVVLSNHSGVRVAVLVSRSEKSHLSKNVAFPGWRKGILQIGVRPGEKPLNTRWEKLGHLLIAGMTQAGKSNFLRSITIQARSEGFKLLLADPDGRTFSFMEDASQLLAPVANTLESCENIVEAALQEIIRRTDCFNLLANKPDNIDEYNARTKEELPRLLVVLDEFNGTVMATGGARGDFAQKTTQIAWRGAKFGVHLVLAGQDFAKDIVGPVREQMSTRFCFQVSNASTSKVVLGKSGAEKIKHPGRALSNRWGMVQTYLVSKANLIQRDPVSGMTSNEKRLAVHLKEQANGQMKLSLLQDYLKVGERQARRLRADWLSRGLAEKVPHQNNGIYLAG